MTTLAEAREAMYQAFVDAWGATTAFTFENEEFDPPNDAAWCRVVVRHNASGQETLGTIGNRRFARFGAVLVQIFVPKTGGMAESDALLTRAREAFEGLTLAGTTVRFGNVTAREVGPDGRWHMSIVEAEFEYDEHR